MAEKTLKEKLAEFLAPGSEISKKMLPNAPTILGQPVNAPAPVSAPVQQSGNSQPVPSQQQINAAATSNPIQPSVDPLQPMLEERSVQSISYTPEQRAAMQDYRDKINNYLAQNEEATANTEALLGRLKNYNDPRSFIEKMDLSPLLQMTGSKMASTYVAPKAGKTEDELIKDQLAVQQMINKGKETNAELAIKAAKEAVGEGSKISSTFKLPQMGNEKITARQGEMAGRFKRANDAENVFNKSLAGYDPTSYWRLITDRSLYPNKLKSNEQQAAETAQNNWIENALRDESGAVINKNEYDKWAKIYFPQKGDSQQTIELKKKFRNDVVDSMRMQGGPAIKQLMAEAQNTFGGMTQIPDKPKTAQSIDFSSEIDNILKNRK